MSSNHLKWSIVDNGTVPFTLSHAAAAFPFRRTRLIPSALVIGTFAPDFEFFLRLAPRGPFGHTLRGVFVFTLPAALIVLWLFHRFLKRPAALLLPEPFQRRTARYLGPFEFLPASRLALIVASILVGIATHLVWDSFTHPQTWLYYHWPFLRQTVFIPIFGMVRYCRVFQYVFTFVGIGILWAWVNRWYHSTKPSHEPCDRQLTPRGRAILLGVIPAVSIILGMMRAIVGASLAARHHSFERVLGDVVVTTIALAWWQLIVCGLLIHQPFFSRPRVYTRAG